MGGGRGGTSRILLPPSSSSSPSSETQTKHFIPWQKRSVCHPRFRDACEQYHEHEKGGGKEGRSGRREDEEESVWILHRGLNYRAPPRQQMFHPSPPLFFSHRCFCARHAKKFFPLTTTLSKSNGGEEDLIYRGGGISSFSIAAISSPEISTVSILK